MYTEGFEGLEEAEKGPRRAYVSNVSQDDADRLARENDRLKKALEKEKFFNKLLDQEIQELKANQGTQPVHSSYWYGNRGVSKGAFFSLLFITLGMAGYIGYGIYNKNGFNNNNNLGASAPAVNEESPATFSTPSAEAPSATNGNTPPSSDSKANTQPPPEKNTSAAAPVENDPIVPVTPNRKTVKDSVPNIIAAKKLPEEKVKASVPAVSEPKEVDIDATVIENAPTVIDTRPVIARYQVSSKANFYSSPDEDALRSTFISQGSDKIVGALEDKNGFIFVVYTNDLGYTSKGWLSKKDLTRLD